MENKTAAENRQDFSENRPKGLQKAAPAPEASRQNSPTIQVNAAEGAFADPASAAQKKLIKAYRLAAAAEAAAKDAEAQADAEAAEFEKRIAAAVIKNIEKVEDEARRRAMLASVKADIEANPVVPLDPAEESFPEDVYKHAPGECIRTEFVDKHNYFPARQISVIAGEKACLKSTGLVSYIADNEDKAWGYFSDGEQDENDIKAKVTGLKALNNNYKWIDFRKIQSETEWATCARFIIKNKIRIIFLDPPHCFNVGISDDATRAFLDPLKELAGKTGAGIVLTRPLNKNEDYKNAVNRMLGSSAWSFKPRAIFAVNKCQIGSLARPAAKDPEASILSCLIRNIGPPMKTCLKFIQRNESIKADDDNPAPMRVSVCSIINCTPDGADFDSLWKKPAEPDIEKQDTRLVFIAGLFEKEDTLKTGHILKRMTAPPAAGGLGISKATAERDLKALEDDKFLEKDGRGKFKITKEFKDWTALEGAED